MTTFDVGQAGSVLQEIAGLRWDIGQVAVAGADWEVSWNILMSDAPTELTE